MEKLTKASNGLGEGDLAKGKEGKQSFQRKAKMFANLMDYESAKICSYCHKPSYFNEIKLTILKHVETNTYVKHSKLLKISREIL